MKLATLLRWESKGRRGYGMWAAAAKVALTVRGGRGRIRNRDWGGGGLAGVGGRTNGVEDSYDVGRWKGGSLKWG